MVVLKKRAKRMAVAGMSMVFLMLVAAAAVPFYVRGPTSAEPMVLNMPRGSWTGAGERREDRASLRVMTLNMAHGRSDGWHQALQRRVTIESNLDAMADVLLREKPDVVALQEADGPSLWSGKFDHAQYLADKAGFPHLCRGEHVNGMKLSYGTGLLSRLPMDHSVSRTFASSPPTPPKGFVVCTVRWPADPAVEIDVVSVHLDFLRQAVRRRQVREMIAELSGRGNPLVVMGDLNCEWEGEDAPIRTLAEELDLTAYEPDAEGMDTFPSHEKRFDWILLSSELRFVKHETIDDVVSDHRAVVAEIEVACEEGSSEVCP
jgi:endonuclease/exonuclease/phosphatase family metal-dependent hydrolase